MDSRNGNAAATVVAAAAPLLPHHPAALLALPDLDRPPAIMEMWELEAVAAALPAKKRRLRETFDRLAACSPTPLPFRWEDLDDYISSLQYSVTLRHRHRHLRELDRPAPAPVAVCGAPPAAAADVVACQMRILEESRPVSAARSPVLALPAVSERVSTGRDGHTLRTLVKSEPVHDPAPSPAAVSAPAAATRVGVENGKKRKTWSQETDAIHAAARVQEAQAEMRKMREDAAAKKPASPLPQDVNSNGKKKLRPASPLQEDTDCNGKKSRPFPPGPGHDNSGLADTTTEANASTDAVVQVAPVSEIPAVLQKPGPTPASAAVSAAAAAPVTGIQEVESEAAIQRTQMQDHLANISPDVDAAMATPCRPGRGSGSDLPVNAVTTHQVDVDPIPKITSVRHESVVAACPPKVTSLLMANKAPKQEPDVASMDVVEPILKITGVRHETPAVQHEPPAGNPPKVSSLPLADKVPKQERPDVAAMETVEAEQQKQELPDDEVPDVEMEIVEPEEEIVEPEVPDVEMEIVEPEEMQYAPPEVADEKASPPQPKAREVSPLPLACNNGGLAQARTTATATPVDAGGATVCQGSPTGTRDVPVSAPKRAAVHAATRDASDAAARSPRAGRRDDASKVAHVPPRGGNGLIAQSGVSIDAALARRDSQAAAMRPGANGTDLVQSTGREATTGPSQARAPPKANNKRVLQKQHMPKQGYHHERTFSSAPNQNHYSFSTNNNHGGRPTGYSQPVPEAQAATAQWSRPGEGRGGLRHGGIGKGKAPMFCTKCGCKGHLAETCRTAKHLFCTNCGCKGHVAETCRTAKHLVALYQKSKAEREDNQICHRCGCTGHWSRKCRTPKHLVDLYQKDQAAKRAAQGTVASQLEFW